MKKFFLIAVVCASIFACSESAPKDAQQSGNENSATTNNNSENPSYDPERGAGKFTSVEVSPTLDKPKAEAGQKVYDVKCASCHKLSDERLVGPGWKGVTSRHKPEWIMNFVTNVDEMLDKDPKAQAQLEICLVRMPNQNLTDDDARNVYEFMRKNDGVQ